MTAILYVLVLAIPLLGTSLLLPPVVRFCRNRDWLDYPGGRKQHDAPVPRLGGIAFVISFTATVVLGFAVAPFFASIPWVNQLVPSIAAALAEAHGVKPQLLGLVAGAMVIFGVGFADDVFGERFHVGFKFAGQCIAAGIAVGAGIRVEFTGVYELNLILSFLWIVGISNAFNLLDNMDGLSAGVAVSSAVILFINAFALEEIFLCLVLAAFIGSLGGFLRHNLHPARVFMGDSGALFIGFVLSSLTILEHYVSPASSSLFAVLLPPLVLAVPLLDTLSVVVIRVREGRAIYRGDRRHLSHRLVAAGLSEPQAVKFLFLLTLALGLGALNLADASVERSLWSLTYTVAVAVLVVRGIGTDRSRFDERGIAKVHAPRSTEAAEGL